MYASAFSFTHKLAIRYLHHHIEINSEKSGVQVYRMCFVLALQGEQRWVRCVTGAGQVKLIKHIPEFGGPEAQAIKEFAGGGSMYLSMAIYSDPPLANKIDPPFIV